MVDVKVEMKVAMLAAVTAVTKVENSAAMKVAKSDASKAGRLAEL